MSVAVIADSHLGGPGGSAEPFVQQVRSLVDQGCHHLVLLGDIFHVWIGKRAFETPLTDHVLDCLSEVAAQGVRLDYIEGNRDFFVDASRHAGIFHTIGTELAVEAGGVRYLFVHGDGLNDRDRQYLFWRWLSKSLPVRWATVALPPRVARWMMHSVESSLSKTNFKHKMEIPKEAILRYAGPRLAEGHDVLMLGHFHEPRSWPTENGEVRIVDAWFNHHHVEWLGAAP